MLQKKRKKDILPLIFSLLLLDNDQDTTRATPPSKALPTEEGRSAPTFASASKACHQQSHGVGISYRTRASSDLLAGVAPRGRIVRAGETAPHGDGRTSYSCYAVCISKSHPTTAPKIAQVPAPPSKRAAVQERAVARFERGQVSTGGVALAVATRRSHGTPCTTTLYEFDSNKKYITKCIYKYISSTFPSAAQAK